MFFADFNFMSYQYFEFKDIFRKDTVLLFFANSSVLWFLSN